MGFRCGIVGLPNVGKSTLFNALTNSSKAQAENFPFCTIDPNIGLVPVPDERLDKLFSISNSNKKIYTTISFDDLCAVHSNEQAMATIALTPMISPYGVVDTDESMVTGFREKPQLPYWINSGAYLLNKETIDLFPNIGDHETKVFPDLAQEGKLAALKSHAFWRSLETIKDLDIIGEFLNTNQN